MYRCVFGTTATPHWLERTLRCIVAAFVLPLLAGCMATNSSRVSYRVPARPVVDPFGIVFVANGSGDIRSVTTSLSQVVSETRAPLQIETFVWSRASGRYVLDHVDHENHIVQGRRLAARITAYRQAAPDRTVHVIGHSAGCAVVLAAAEVLPPDSVDRIVLLAPSVCASYDLRPALRATRSGLDSFHSCNDTLVLGLGMRIVGTADGGCDVAAGQVGFTPAIACPADAALYGKLHQHSWDAGVEWTGNEGGHYGNNQPTFLRAYVLPLFLNHRDATPSADGRAAI